MSLARLHLLRHGQSLWNRQNRFTGWADVALSDTGIAEAEAVAEIMRAQNTVVDCLLTSQLQRAIATADVIVRRLGWESVARHRDWRLNERHYGALQGKNKDEVRAQYGEAQVQKWRRSYDTPPPVATDTAEVPAWFDGDAMPTGESLKMVVPRVVAVYEERMLPLLREGRSLLVVAHGNSLRALMKHLEDIDDTAIMAVDIKTGELTSYTFETAGADGALRIVDKSTAHPDDRRI